MRIAMIGTRGVPARYGGFETCIEEIGYRLVDAGHEVIVYCRNGNDLEGLRPSHYRGMQLVHLPAMKKKSLETLSHTGLSVAHLVTRRLPDAAFVFNAANSPFIPVLRARKVPIATHVDGLEWKRAKWGKAGRTYYRAAESLSMRWSEALIADAQGIADYYTDEFGVDTRLIRYGAPRVSRGAGNPVASMDLTPDDYHLVVARFEPENHVHVIVEGYVASGSTKPLVVVGGAPYGDDYIAKVHAMGDARVRFVGGIWDQDLLDQLYANAFTYWHGHSVGGTNPSLLRAIGAEAATNAFDVSFNREVLGEAGRFFTTPADVAELIASDEADPDPASVQHRRQVAGQRAAQYDWDEVAHQYEQLAKELAAGERVHAKASGRRLGGRAKQVRA